MHDFQIDITNCIQVLKNGGLILYPTDTVWAVGCDATNELAVEKLYTLLNRSNQENSIVLVASERSVLNYATQVDLSVFDIVSQIQQPTTVVYDSVIGISNKLIASDGSAAIRICNDEFCKHLIKRLQQPIVAACAKLGDDDLPVSFQFIHSTIKNNVDYAVVHKQNELLSSSLSTIVRYEKNGTLTYLRT